MMIPGAAIWKTQAQKEYEGWTDVEWTNSTDIMMGSLTYGYKIKVPTEDVKGWRVIGGGSGTPEVVASKVEEHGSYHGDCWYTVGGDKYCFEMIIDKPEHYESMSMTKKALKNMADKLRQYVDDNHTMALTGVHALGAWMW
jgi:hypothetical protein